MSARRARLGPAHVVILAGVCAALHVGKLPPAVTALQQALSIGLVEAGFLLSLVQLAGMTAGLAVGALADALGLRRSMIAGLATLAAASALGGFADGAAMLMVLRAVEGFGFLLAVLPGPALVRQHVAPERLAKTLGLWSAYMPLATAIALLAGPLVIAAVGWRVWWWLLAAVTAATAGWLAARVPSSRPAHAPSAAVALAWWPRLARTLAARGPWLAALSFAAYSAQWLAVIGFLPAIYEQAGIAPALVGVLTAVVAAGNIVGNVASGRLLHRGAAPARLLAAGFAGMAIGSILAFAAIGLPAALRYAAVVGFSMVGGIVPGTLFALAVRVAPGEQTLSSTVGWLQQWSAFGQFCGPPAVAWLAAAVGGWHYTWVVTGGCALAGIALAAVIARLPVLQAAAAGPVRPTREEPSHAPIDDSGS